MNDSKRIELFERAPVKTAVLMQILPALASQMVILIYNLADIWFVGLLNNPVATAAITICHTPFFVLIVIANLFGVGASSAISRALGRHDRSMTENISAYAFWHGIIIAIIYSILCFAFKEPFLFLCGASKETVGACISYFTWTTILGGPFAIMSLILSHLVRSEGSATVASVGVMFGSLLNIIIDPFFVLPQFLNLGATGAGMATGLSNFCSAMFFIAYITKNRQRTVLSLSIRRAKLPFKYVKEILSVGFPAAIQLGLTVVSEAALTFFMSGYGTTAVAALGIAKKLDNLPVAISVGIANGLMPLLAYNYSSGNQKRRQAIFRFGVSISVACAVICLICYEIFAKPLCGFFISDETTIVLGAAFLRRLIIAMPFASICYPMIVSFQAMKEAKISLICSIIRKGTLDIPFLFLMNVLFPMFGLVLVQPIVDLISLIIELRYYRMLNRQ